MILQLRLPLRVPFRLLSLVGREQTPNSPPSNTINCSWVDSRAAASHKYHTTTTTNITTTTTTTTIIISNLIIITESQKYRQRYRLECFCASGRFLCVALKTSPGKALDLKFLQIRKVTWLSMKFSTVWSLPIGKFWHFGPLHYHRHHHHYQNTSEMEVTPRYKPCTQSTLLTLLALLTMRTLLSTLLTLLSLLSLFPPCILFPLPSMLKHYLNSGIMPKWYIYCYMFKSTPLIQLYGFMGFWAKCWTGWMGDGSKVDTPKCLIRGQWTQKYSPCN